MTLKRLKERVAKAIFGTDEGVPTDTLDDAMRMHRMAHQDLCKTIGHYRQINRRRARDIKRAL
jgi:hypothetical protein